MSNLLMSLLFLSLVSAIPTDVHEKQVFIVYMGSLPSRTDYSPVSHHIKILQEITGESSVEHLLLTSYKKSFNGFVALLTESERERLSKSNEVVSVFPNKSFQLHTTTSWNFMGLKEGKGTKRNPPVESDTIIGVIDSGITPESDSFSCEGFAPPPKKWKGVCLGGNKFPCNKKLIGARDYTGKGDVRDYIGHGTHTASIAAGNAVPNTSFYGIGNGTVRGAVPASRIAVYKACVNECIFNHTLSAFEDAIHDGVDLITISLGADKSQPVYESDAIAIGAFHAMAKGILTVQSAGNEGPKSASVVSVAPWILTVAASTTNRGFFTKVVLGNGKTLLGKSVNLFDHEGKKYPLVYGKSAALKSCDEKSAKECSIDCLDESLVNGSILVCNESFGLGIAQYFGAIAVVGKNPKVDVANIDLFPISILPEDDFNSLVSYIESTDSPQAAVLKTEAIYNQTAPKIASFSSRGPNNIVADLLKPDISAPGVEILAAYSPEASLTEDGDTRHVKYSILSGTSMSCPHVAGVAAYVKSFHPEWSPSMIKSSIMTTAWVMKPTETGFVSSEFAYGAGHIDPIAALTPGLVYELTKADYISFLCGLNYNGPKLKLITGDTDTCTGKTLARNLNYPSMSAKIPEGNSSFSVTFIRTVTNVGNPNSTYKANVVVLNCSKLNVEVLPCVLTFNSVAEKKTFTVTVTGNGMGGKAVASANLIWSDGIYNVKSPIVMYSL